MAEEGDNSLTVLDAARNVVATTLTGLAGPHNVQIGHDGHTVYATSSANMVVAIDTKTYQVAAAAATGPASSLAETAAPPPAARRPLTSARRVSTVVHWW